MTKLIDIEGIGAVNARKLKKAGVRGTGDLLRKGGTDKGRKELAKASGVTHKKILEWVNHSDLLRITGVGPEFADLLEATGVDTVMELKNRKPEKLTVDLANMSKKKNLTNRVPNLKAVKSWVAQAKKLKRAVSY